MKRLSIILAVLAAALVAASTALAGNPACTALVSDQAGVLSGASSTKIASAANALENATGANVHVQFVKHVANADVDSFAHDEGQSCSNWRNVTGGGVRSNLLVFIVATDDHQFGIYPGDEFKPMIDPSYSGIEADMKGFFRAGDWAGALTTGLKEVQQKIHDYQHPKPQGTTIVNKKPTNLTWLWILLGIVIGAGLLSGVGFLLVGVRKREQSRKDAQTEALKLKNTVADQIVSLSQADDDLKRALEIVKLNVGDAEKAELEQLHTKAETAVGAATQGWQELDTPDENPEHKLRVEQYQSVTTRLQQIAKDAATASAAIAACQKKADELTALYNAVPKEIEALGQEIEGAKPEVADAQKQGYKTDEAEKELVSAAGARDAAQKALDGKDVEQANHAVSMGHDLVRQATAWLKALPQLKASLDQDAAKVAARITEATALVEKTKPVFESMHSDYAPSCWDAVKGNGSVAEAQIAQATAAHDASTKAAAMDTQAWEDAQAALDHANAALDQATKLCQALADLKSALDQAKASCPADVETASQEIEKAQAYVSANDDDLSEELEASLDQARKLVAQAQTELKKEKPDYLVAAKQAAQAQQTADKVLADARSEKEQMDALRRQVQSSESSAQAAVQQAASYISSHHSDVRSGAEGLLTQAQSQLAAAQGYKVTVKSHETADRDQHDGYTQQVSLFEQAEQTANQAYTEARRDVQDAEDERRRRREEEERQRQSSYNNLGTGIAIGSALSDFGGGGGGGGFGDFGGGSSGFGGGGDFGGGSSGW